MRYELFSGPPSADLQVKIFQLYEAIFGVPVPEGVPLRLYEVADLMTLLAIDDAGRPVGYKIGYRQSEGVFYSWVGGVLPHYRGQGVASQLMRRQHEWAAKQGYVTVQTKTLNRWRSMLILNLQHGFSIIQAQPNEAGVVEIIMEKSLV